ncbi:LOW QUALITY PROTEIN: hypothetical protein BT93_C2279 [Corymbia citriodora subsp. variegata]|nr:LOW QUALITY PROTEIN: hypothetical protein BT93_C2279 [Corymbia citriodora subsp. variegata]
MPSYMMRQTLTDETNEHDATDRSKRSIQCNGTVRPLLFPSSTHHRHLLRSPAVLRALITGEGEGRERERCLLRRGISKCRTSITSVDDMKKEAASTPVQPVRAVLLLLLLRDLRVLLGDALLLLPLTAHEHHVYHSVGDHDVL